MTQPTPLPLEDQVPDAEVLAHEAQAVQEVTGGLGSTVAHLLATMLAAHAAGAAGPSLAAVILVGLERARWRPMTPALRQVARDAVDLGVDRTLRDLPRRDRRKGRSGEVPDLKVPDLDLVTQQRLREAGDLARKLDLETKRDLMAVAGKVSSARSHAEGQVRWTTHEGINAGTSAVAERTGRALIWVAERNACLHCLAHAGWSVRPGKLFPASLTYGDRPLRSAGVLYPPLHPNCRCQVRPWGGPVGRPPADRDRVDPAARMAAEARRSVVYGWTDHASQAATLRAMDRLLQRGAALPVSVERRARDLVRKGRTMGRPKH